MVRGLPDPGPDAHRVPARRPGALPRPQGLRPLPRIAEGVGQGNHHKGIMQQEPKGQVPLERDINIVVNGCSGFATSTQKGPFTAMLILHSRGTCLIDHSNILLFQRLLLRFESPLPKHATFCWFHIFPLDAIQP